MVGQFRPDGDESDVHAVDDNAANNSQANIDNGIIDDVSEMVDGPTVSAYVDLAVVIQKRLYVADIAAQTNNPDFPRLLRLFLYDQLHPDGPLTSSDVPLSDCPTFDGKIAIYNSAAATYHAPSDPSGIGGMRREHIRATPSWRRGPARYDCAFVNSRPDIAGMRGFDVVRVLMFFSFRFRGKSYSCALVHWYTHTSDEPDQDTGMWMVEPELDGNNEPVISVIPLECIFRAAHLCAVYGDSPIPLMFPHDVLDAFSRFYVNKFVDHHAFTIAS